MNEVRIQVKAEFLLQINAWRSIEVRFGSKKKLFFCFLVFFGFQTIGSEGKGVFSSS